MLPMKALRLQLGTALAADVPTLAPAAANKIALIAAPFTPVETMLLASLTLASFTGSAPIAGAVGAQPVVINPGTEQQIIKIKEPAGGYLFICTAAPTPPQVIYGYCLIDNAGAVLLAVALFATPITISEIGHFVEIDDAQLTFVLQPMS